MDDYDLAELAREYGLDPSEYEDFAVGDPIEDYETAYNHGGYEEADEHESGPVFSSPCPPERPANAHRASAQYRPSLYTFASSSNARGSRYTNTLPPLNTQQQIREMPTQHDLQYSHEISPAFSRYERAANSAAMESNLRNQTAYEEAKINEPRNVHGIRLRPTSDLPDIYRALFKFGVFNAVQSKCFDKVMDGDDNLVISAPTGSGKTVLFELAIIRMLMQAGPRGRESKCIYVAPTKALCSEKYRDWVSKFQSLGINCCELTGDTVQFGRSAWGDARNATIIVTTGEKWDSLTRNWEEHEQTLSQIQLFLVDEVHILNESRGSTLEVIVSRMKARGSSVRFLLVSATVPNIQDVANWIGNAPHGGSAKIMEFGEEYRPCKLTRHVYGVHRKKDQNDFVFSRNLDFKLYGILKSHSVNKPVLVFCSTRKGVMTTAEQLMKEYEQNTAQKENVPWTRPRRIDATFHDKRLEKLATCGIGIHHAGMSLDDRRATEDLYLNKILRVIVATSTLAVGVNLPAHTVVIKGVKIFQNNVSQEYSDLDIMQMMGRAGRPQFDKEGVAIIMCEADLKPKYDALVQGRTILESSLHLNLAEHINSEIGLGTIRDVESAKAWLHNSFLFQRIQQNPRHYAIGKDSDQTWQDRVDGMVTQSIDKLKESELVMSSEEDQTRLLSTEFGDIMSKYYVRQSTMSAILKMPDRASLKDMLDMLCTAEEFTDIKIRSGEKQIYNKLRLHDDIRFKLKKVEKASDKICLIIQAVLGGISLNDPEYKNGDNQPSLEALTVFRHVERITRAMVDVAIAKKCGSQVKHGLELLRCLGAKAWEDRPVVLRQIEHIGEKSIKVLVQHGIKTLADVRKQDPLRIETLLNRRPPFGHEVLAYVKQLPQYMLEIEETSTTPSDGVSPVEVELSIDCGLVHDLADAPKPRKGKHRFRQASLVVTVTSDLEYIDFRRISTKALQTTKSFSVTALLTKPSQTVIVQITSEATAGLAVTKIYKPNIPQHYYPTMDTRPPTSAEFEMENIIDDGLADNPEFWVEMGRGLSEDEDEVQMIDLTKTDGKKPQSQSRPKETKSPLKDKMSREDRTSQGSQTLPKKMPNGNYACNHTCKDKTKCRHLCCREGLPKPPPLTKKQVETRFSIDIDNVKEAQVKPKPVVTQKQPKPPVVKEKLQAQAKPDHRMQALEKLHERNSVKANIHLPEGRRIKLDDGIYVTKPRATFEMDFTELDTGDNPDEPVIACLSELSDESDELPAMHALLTDNKKNKLPKDSKKLKGSSSNYDDSEMDELIRRAPSPIAGAVARSSAGQKKEVLDLASPSPLIKKRSFDECGPSLSREKDPGPRSPKRRKTVTFRPTTSTPLFLPDDEEDELIDDESQEPSASFQPPRPRYDEQFEIDDSIFDIQQASSPPPQASLMQSVSANHSLMRNDPMPLKSSATSLSHRPYSSKEAGVKNEAAHIQPPEATAQLNPYEDDLAELDAWLNSGSVVIVDHLD